MDEQGFDSWALVELMGHQRIAGRVTEAQIGGAKFVRVDVPASDGLQPLTKYLGPASIYAITPITEDTAVALAKQLKVAPVSKYDARVLFEDKSAKALPQPLDPDDFVDGDPGDRDQDRY